MFRLGALVTSLNLCRPFGQDSQGNLGDSLRRLDGFWLLRYGGNLLG
jgi:hypothetical protein